MITDTGEILNDTQKKKKQSIFDLTKFINPGKILECGCGSGFVLEILSHHFEDSTLLGIDKSFERLEMLNHKHLCNVFPVQADITHIPCRKRSCTAVLFISSLHEVFSRVGDEGVYQVLNHIHSLLEDEGTLIIQDFLKPPPQQVELKFKREDARKRFIRFASEYRVRSIPYEETRFGVKLDIGDAMEFFSKCRSISQNDWEEEMDESHYYYTQDEFKKMADNCSFSIVYTSLLLGSGEVLDPLSKEMRWKFSLPHRYIQLVLIPV
ncbi:MAG: methyltransferase domain-containing protein [Theionarchaea archaeon]|nr:methyltransferase domain-containing protein [Theionarchaea archaeon]